MSAGPGPPPAPPRLPQSSLAPSLCQPRSSAGASGVCGVELVIPLPAALPLLWPLALPVPRRPAVLLPTPVRSSFVKHGVGMF